MDTLKRGDRVIFREAGDPGALGEKGTVEEVSGGMYWVALDIGGASWINYQELEALGSFSWEDWQEDERDGVFYLTINDPDGEEYAIIVHRTCEGEYPLDGVVAKGKEVRAELMVDILNSSL